MMFDGAWAHRIAWWLVLAACGFGCGAVAAAPRVIDGFENTDAWTLILADGVKGEIVAVDGALRLDYDFTAGAGYCVVQRSIDLPIDPNYRFGFRWKGTGPKNTLEFKLIDPSGENVWWSVRRGIEFPEDWAAASIRRRHVSFAWGPSEGGPLRRIGALEFAVTASEGGKGSIWLDDLVYEALPEAEPEPTEPHAVTSGGEDLGRLPVDGSVEWAGQSGEGLVLRWDHAVEFSAVELEWAGRQGPQAYRLESSIDGERFTTLGRVTLSEGGTRVLFTPESEARSVRLSIEGGSGELAAIRFLPVEQLKNANDYFAMLSGRSPRGSFPAYFETLTPWAVVGLPGKDEEALVSGVGAIEPVKGGYSLEPFIVRDRGVLSWADAEITHSLEDGSLPIPSVHWSLDGLTLDVTALVTDDAGMDRVLGRYVVTNTGDERARIALALAARPFQVLPAAQFLNIVGGAATGDSIELRPLGTRLDGRLFASAHMPADRLVVSDAAGSVLVDQLANGSRWGAGHAERSGSFPSGAMIWQMVLEPGASSTVVVAMPMTEEAAASMPAFPERGFGEILDEELARWRGILGRTEILLPESASRLRDTVRANLAYILINADGPGIQPGSRTYERSWIRDGSMTSAALLALGHADEARAFIDWYSGFQYPSGKVPCVVDARGPDPVDENDAPGEYLFAIRNSAEAGGGFDESFARRMYPSVRSAVGYIETMRNERLTPAFAGADDAIVRACAGLMPESISHEGYSAKPMHSHWDNFWVYRGLKDAAALAERLGESEDQARFAGLAADFGRSIGESIDATASVHGIDYVPGCVELGDFDATSTSIAFYPTGASEVIDPGLLEATFERAWRATNDRIGGGAWDGMTPYEVRLIGTFVRLGWVDRAHAYLGWLMDRQDPGGWAQWGEIAYREREPVRFVGDMPHTWVGSGAVLSILSMFAYEDGDAMVLGAGIPGAWISAAEPVGVRRQMTRHGPLSFELSRRGDSLVVEIGPGCTPPGGFRIDAARLLDAAGLAGGRPSVLLEGRTLGVGSDGMVRVPRAGRVEIGR